MADNKRKFYPKKGAADSKIAEASANVEKEILAFWKELASKDTVKWERPWVMNMLKAENGGKYMTSGERYVYRGSFNQCLIAYYSRDKGAMGPVILNRTDMAKMFGVEKFEQTPLVGSKDESGEFVPGVKSLGSIFKPSTYNKWFNANGTEWQPAKGSKQRYPSKQQIESEGLTKRTVMGSFKPYPVWSLADVYPRLTDELKAKADQLMDKRIEIGYKFDPEDDFQQYIYDVVNDMVIRSNVQVNYGMNNACYYPTKDVIDLPNMEQFINPLEWYTTTIHELAHSTSHLNGRRPTSSGSKLFYAVEEVIAETTAMMMVKKLEESLQDIMESRPDVQEMFTNFYEQTHTYVKHYGSQTDLLKLVETVESEHLDQASDKDKKPFLVKGMMTDIIKSIDALSEQSFTIEQRREAKQKNFTDPRWSKDRQLEAAAAEPGLG